MLVVVMGDVSVRQVDVELKTLVINVLSVTPIKMGMQLVL
jgi:hypothetical protein